MTPSYREGMSRSLLEGAAMGHAGSEYTERVFSEEIVLKAYLEQCERLLGKP